MWRERRVVNSPARDAFHLNWKTGEHQDCEYGLPLDRKDWAT